MKDKSSSVFLLIGFLMGCLGVFIELYITIANRVMPLIPALIKFFSYFTILTNALVAITFIILWIKKPVPLYQKLNKAGSLTAITVYILVVGIVYNLILRPSLKVQPSGLGILSNEILHSFIPVYFLIFWLIFVDKTQLVYKEAKNWLIYPLVYLVYTFIRGAITKQYPYFFVDVSIFGFGSVLINCLILFVVFLILFYLFIWIGKLLVKK
jgi:hypothetical protein